MRPAVGGRKPATEPSSVDLPDPEGPIREKNSPGSMTRSVGASATKMPYRLVKPLRTTLAPWLAMRASARTATRTLLQKCCQAEHPQRECEDERCSRCNYGSQKVGHLLPHQAGQCPRRRTRHKQRQHQFVEGGGKRQDAADDDPWQDHRQRHLPERLPEVRAESH